MTTTGNFTIFDDPSSAKFLLGAWSPLDQMLVDLGGVPLCSPDDGCTPILRAANFKQTTPQPTAASTSTLHKQTSLCDTTCSSPLSSALSSTPTCSPGSSPATSPSSSPVMDSDPEFDQDKKTAAVPATLSQGRKHVVKRTLQKIRVLYDRIKADPRI
jgi:hypothetical protein